jgi:hypothetical protein
MLDMCANGGPVGELVFERCRLLGQHVRKETVIPECE